MTDKLNWGAGPDVPPGWVNSDRDSYPGLDHVGDIADGLPFATGSFDIVVSHHALQMVAYPRLVHTLAELRRVLRRGGVLRVSVPDLEVAWRAYEEVDAAHFLIDEKIEQTIDGKLCAYLMQCGSTRSVFTGPWLCELFKRTGITDAWVTNYRTTKTDHADSVELDTRPAESLFVEALR